MLVPSINEIANDILRRINLQGYVRKGDLANYATKSELQQIKSGVEKTKDQSRNNINKFPIAQQPTTSGVGAQQQQCIGFGLFKKGTEVWMNSGTINGEIPTGFGSGEKFIASGGSGVAWAKIKINSTTGETTSTPSINSGSSRPTNTATDFHFALGGWSYINGELVITNFGCGSITYDVCRNWYTSLPPYFSVTISR